MSAAEPFTFVEEAEDREPQLFQDYRETWSGKGVDIDVQLATALKKNHPDLIVTSVPASNVNLLLFANAGFATATLDSETEPVARWRAFLRPPPKGGVGSLADINFFARYHYKWNEEFFVLYTALTNVGTIQYILKEPKDEELVTSHSSVTDSLLFAIGSWQSREVDGIWVYDGYWRKDVKLWEQVQKSTWKDVILNEKTKKSLQEVSEKFFDSKPIYDDYGVPWKRGVIFHGPVGNGKTISLRAMMRHLIEDKNVNVLYVKAAPYTYQIRAVFHQARQLAPCMLVLEDIDAIVTKTTKSYFFNEVDGLENNDGILMVATTNHLDELDPGLSKRPSRFDRKYLFPLPSLEERTLYSEYWRNKLKDKPIDFPKKLSPAIAKITDDFSFAYMKEAFVATLLDLARNSDSEDESDDEPGPADERHDDDLDRYAFWRAMKCTVKTLRKDMDSSTTSGSVDRGSGPIHPVGFEVAYGGPPPDSASRQPGRFDPSLDVSSMEALAFRLKHDKHNAVDWSM